MDDELYYYVGEKKIYLYPSPETTAINYPSSSGKSFEDEVKKLQKNYPSNDLQIFSDKKIVMVLNDRDFQKNAEIKAVLSDEHIDLQVFDTENNLPVMINNELLVKFRPDVTQNQINEFNAAHNVTIKKILPYDRNYYLLVSYAKTAEEQIMLANKYHENKELVVFAQPNFLRLYHNASVPADPLFNLQWYLKNTGQNNGVKGEDINIEEAWKISKGDPSVTIAIIDTGVDYTHSDLRGDVPSRLKQGFNAINSGTDQQPLHAVSHGTSCAGIAAALTNTIGIAGVAPDCSLLGIKISDESHVSLIKDSVLTEALNKAVELKVDVICCSWSGVDESSVIIDALNKAKIEGRGGKGCIVVFAAGNISVKSDGTIDRKLKFPANSPLVLTVSGCNESGEFKRYNDGGKLWGSRSGTQVDVCAPGASIVSLANADQFDLNFEGTSASAPLVAGTAALMFSVDSNLSAKDVEKIIKDKARKRNGINYPNEFYGQGFLDAGEAVKTVSNVKQYPDIIS